MRSDKDEALRWLSACNSNGVKLSGRNRPVLYNKNGEVIREIFVKAVLEFKTVTLCTNILKLNTTHIEDMIQARLPHLSLGERLFQFEGMGDNWRDQVDFTTEVHRVFSTYSTKVMDFIDRGEVRWCA
jgi:hypothetical protein